MEHETHDGDPGTRRFRVWVQGRLAEGFSEGLAGIDQEEAPTGTMLSGALLDQSQLHSTLDLLRSLGIEVLRFEVDPPRTPEMDAAGNRRLHETTDRPSERWLRHNQGKSE